jgi:hypothetical protein
MATMDKGQLMVRHPHFTQPVFVRFPRPAVMSGREGAERFPPGAEPTLDVAVTRALRRLDPAVSLAWVQDVIALSADDEVLKARRATELARPADVRAYFKSQLKAVVAPTAARAPAPTPLRAIPDDDPYAF